MKNAKSKLLSNSSPKGQANKHSYHDCSTNDSKEYYCNNGFRKKYYCNSGFRKECSKLCHHLPPKKSVKIDIEKSRRRVAFLKIQIEYKTKSLQECKGQYFKITGQNEILKRDLLQLEDNVFSKARSTLQEYEKLSSVFRTLSIEKYPDHLNEELQQFELIKKQLSAELDKLNKEIKNLEDLIDEENSICKTLKHFKDITFAENQHKISCLKEQILIINQSHQKEYKSFQNTHKKISASINLQKLLDVEGIKADFCQLVYSSMDCDVICMADENILLKKEISIHKNETSFLSNDVKMLENQVQKLQFVDKLGCETKDDI